MDFRSPGFGQPRDQIPNPAGLNLGDRHELPAAGATALLARDALALPCQRLLGERYDLIGEAIEDTTKLLVDQQDVTPLGLAYQAIELQAEEDPLDVALRRVLRAMKV